MKTETIEPKASQSSGPCDRRADWLGQLVGPLTQRPGQSRHPGPDGGHARIHWPAAPGTPVDELPAMPRHFREMDDD